MTLYEKKFNYRSKFHEIDKEVIDFCKIIKSNKSLITIGTIETINNNHSYKLTSLNSLDCFLEKTLKNNYLLIDFTTFNFVKFNDMKSKYLVEKSVESYKEDILYCKNFDEFYLLVDYSFMNNFRNIIKEIFLNNYTINIYMFENYYFMLYFKRDSSLIDTQIKFIRNKCMNQMLEEESEKIGIKEVEEFIQNYYNLILTKNFFQNENEAIDTTYLFDFKNRINYILDLCIKPSVNNIQINNQENRIKPADCRVEILSVKNEFNKYYDYLFTDFIDNFNNNKIIFVRKTEFGEIYEKKRIQSILDYLFKIKDINIIDKSIKETEKLDIIKCGMKYNNNDVIKIIEKNNVLPFLIQPNLEIDSKQIPLIEYNYFLAMPLLLNIKEDKPNILILANDFGLLNYYYNILYKNKFNISSFMETKENIIDKQNIFKINNNNIKIMDFIEVVKERLKIIDSNIKNYDLIILELFKQRNEKDKSIPELDLITYVKKIINFDGILAFNLRTESYDKYNTMLEDIKKRYKKTIEINLRPCSGFIICSENKNIKLEKYYMPMDFQLDSNVIDEIEKKFCKL